MPSERSLLRLVGSGINIDILNVIRHEPSGTRDIARFLGKDETDVSRRLRLLEKGGIVKGAWTRKKERNVKAYSLLGFRAEIDFGPSGLMLQLKTPTETRTQISSSLGGFEIPSMSGFVGRKKELDAITSEEGLHVIIGLPGVGKTSLAAAYANLAKKKRPVFWHSAREVDTLGYVGNRLATFLARFGYGDALEYVKSAGDEDTAKIELVGRGIEAIGGVAIIDDFHRNRDDRLEILLESIWRNCSAVKLVVLSRTRPRFYSLGPKTFEHWLQGFSIDETRAFLSSKRIGMSPTSAEALWRKIAGHPLSLTVFCSLARDKATIAVDSIEQERAADYFFREVQSTLNPGEQDVLSALSVFRAPVSQGAISAIFHIKRLGHLLHSLEGRMLVNRTGGFFQIHELVRESYYRFLDSPQRVHSRAGEYYLGLATPEALLEAFFHLNRAGETKKIVEIVRKEIEDGKYGLVEGGYSAPLLASLDMLSGPVVGRDLFYLLCMRGRARSKLGDWKTALKNIEEAVFIARSTNEKTMLAHAAECRAEYHYWRGEFEETEKHLLRAAEMFEQNGPSQSLQGVYSKLARLNFSLGRHDRAKRFAELADNPDVPIKATNV